MKNVFCNKVITNIIVVLHYEHYSFITVHQSESNEHAVLFFSQHTVSRINRGRVTEQYTLVRKKIRYKQQCTLIGNGVRVREQSTLIDNRISAKQQSILTDNSSAS